MLSFSAAKPVNLGLANGQLAPLPESPNAVSTQTDDDDRKMPPIEFSGDAAAMMDKLKAIINDLPRSSIVTMTEDYLHVEFRSLIFRFVDDVEFFIDREESRIHFRSKSRVGHSDLGVNRKRMENITKLIRQQQAN